MKGSVNTTLTRTPSTWPGNCGLAGLVSSTQTPI